MVYMRENARTTSVDIEYDDIVESIKLVLKRRHKLTARDAEEAIRISPIKDIFEEDFEMAAHTSNEAWAREIYQFWKSKKNRE